MKEIQLSKGKAALVDDDDFKELSQWKWYADKASRERDIWYAKRKANKKNIKMHRQILGLLDSKIHTDHRDHNGLNNQRSNLREATIALNNMNRQSHKGAFSKYKGVYFKKQTKRWAAMIQKDYVLKHIGYFVNEKDAALAYNKKALELHGEFANLNIIE